MKQKKQKQTQNKLSSNKQTHMLHNVLQAHVGRFWLLKDAFGKLMVAAGWLVGGWSKDLLISRYSSRACGFTLHLYKSSIGITFLTRHPELIFQKEKQHKNSLSQHALLCLLHLLKSDYKEASRAKQSRLEADCVPSFRAATIKSISC